MEAEEGEIRLIRQAENAPELNTTDSIRKSVQHCSPDLDFSKVFSVASGGVGWVGRRSVFQVSSLTNCK